MTVHLLQRIQRKVDSSARRCAKYLRQAVTYRESADRSPTALFVVGCQRSGTNMLIGVLDESPDSWVYNENHPKAFERSRIKPTAERLRLIRQARCRWVVFKPICDSQNIDRLLADHPGAKAIWIFRGYQDVTNSALRKWGKRQLHLIRQAATSEDGNNWFIDRMSEERRQLIRELYHEEMSWHTAGALKWYVRNALYFDYGLHQRPEEVKLVRYEDLVREPLEQCKAIHDFLGLSFNPAYVADIIDTSIRKVDFPPIDSRVEGLCEEMMNKLNCTLKLHLKAL